MASSRKHLSKAIASALLVASTLSVALPAQAQVVWADWVVTKLTPPTPPTAGEELATFSGLTATATFSGPLHSNAIAAAAASGAGGTAAGSRVSLNTDGGFTHTITFSEAVTDPLVAIWGLQSGPTLNTYKFNQTPIVVSGADFSIKNGTELFGAYAYGADGVVQFLGTYTQLSWTNQCDESSYLSVGLNVAAVPEPQTYALMAAGLGALGWVGRRRKGKAGRYAAG